MATLDRLLVALLATLRAVLVPGEAGAAESWQPRWSLATLGDSLSGRTVDPLPAESPGQRLLGA